MAGILNPTIGNHSKHLVSNQVEWSIFLWSSVDIRQRIKKILWKKNPSNLPKTLAASLCSLLTGSIVEVHSQSCLRKEVATAFTSPFIESQSNYIKDLSPVFNTDTKHLVMEFRHYFVPFWLFCLALLSVLKEMLFCCVCGIWINYCIFCSLCSTN